MLSSYAQAFARPAIAQQADQRFGLSADCGIVRDLGVPWTFNWGHGGAYANQDEEGCAASGLDIFYSLAMIGNRENYTRIADPRYRAYEIGQLENDPSFLADDEDRWLYWRLDRLIGPYIARDPTLSRDAVLQAFLLIPRYAAVRPGAVYQIGNEPDYGPYFAPDDYADLYYIHATRIRKYDPSAQVMIGGLVGSITEVVDDWCATGRAPDPAVHCTVSSADGVTPIGWRFNWIRVFRDAHLAKYGTYPQVDIWNIHPYTFAETIARDYREAKWEDAWLDARDKIVAFRDFLGEIEEGDKPLWLTEVGVGGPHNRFYAGEEGIQRETALVADKFMAPLLAWLKSTPYAQRWFWFAATTFPGRDLGDIWPVGSGYNRLGEVYRAYLVSDPIE